MSEVISNAKKQTLQIFYVFMPHAATCGLLSSMRIPGLQLTRVPSVAFYPVGVDYIAHF